VFRRIPPFAMAVTGLVLCMTGTAVASWAGKDPASNFKLELPSVCGANDENAVGCVKAAVMTLDKARAHLGQPPYRLPTDFYSLTVNDQLFVLVNDDRTLYGLPPVPGVSPELSHDAEGGVRNDSDPEPADPDSVSFTSNWAAGNLNDIYAYLVWMYDDGPGKDGFNDDCKTRGASGCWGHRHNILWEFGRSQHLSMGVAHGADGKGTSDVGFAVLIVARLQPVEHNFTYTWKQALEHGAGN
jgi:hypothetical protein